MCKEDKELDKDLEQQLDWIDFEELDALLTTSSNKLSLEDVNKISVDTFSTEAFSISSQKVFKE